MAYWCKNYEKYKDSIAVVGASNELRRCSRCFFLVKKRHLLKRGPTSSETLFSEASLKRCSLREKRSTLLRSQQKPFKIDNLVDFAVRPNGPTSSRSVMTHTKGR